METMQAQWGRSRQYQPSSTAHQARKKVLVLFPCVSQDCIAQHTGLIGGWKVVQRKKVAIRLATGWLQLYIPVHAFSCIWHKTFYRSVHSERIIPFDNIVLTKSACDVSLWLSENARGNESVLHFKYWTTSEWLPRDRLKMLEVMNQFCISSTEQLLSGYQQFSFGPLISYPWPYNRTK